MGSKPSRVSGTVVATTAGGDGKVIHVPKQAMPSSAPATPLRPDGAPRAEDTDGDPFPPPPREFANAQEAPDCGPPPPPPADVPAGPDAPAPPRRTPRQHVTHSGETGGWPSPQAAAAGGKGSTECESPTVAVNPTAAAVAAAAAANSGATPVAAKTDTCLVGPGGLLRFDAPMEDVLQQATEAFGSIASALSSPKWDRRVQALKGVGTVLKGLDIKASASPSKGNQGGTCRGLTLRDNATCFRAACLILNVALRDKVLPVLFAAHELYQVTFEHSQALVSEDEASFAMGVLLQHILAKLGETNIRLHQSACSAFVFSSGTPPRLTLPAAFARVQKHLDDCNLRGPPRMRVHAGVLDVVTQLLKRFPGRRAGEGDSSDGAVSWSTPDIREFVSAGTQVDISIGTRVRQAAASIAVLVYTTLGKRSLDELMATLPEASQELVKMRIEEETGEILGEDDGDFDDPDDEAGGGEDLPAGGMSGVDLCVMGTAIHLPASGAATGAGKGPAERDPLAQEENFMDEILEATGMVFQGQGLETKAAAKDSLCGNNELDEDLRDLGLLN